MIRAPKRTVRRDPGRARLMPREREGLAFIAAAQPVTTGAYQDYLGMSLAVARRSLRKLRDLGVVRIQVLAMELPSRFVLAPKGRDLLAQTLDRSPESFRVLRGIGKLNLGHHDGVVHLYVALTRAIRSCTSPVIDEFLFEETIRQRTGAARGTVVPDAVGVFRRRDGSRFALAFEIDRATETPRYVAERKGIPYSALRRARMPLSGCSDWQVCCVTTSEHRLGQLALALWDAEVPEGLWYFALDGELSAASILTSAWRTARLPPSAAAAKLIHESPFEPVITDCHDGDHGSRTGFAAQHANLTTPGRRE